MDKFTYKKERHLSASKVTLPSCIVGRNHWTCLVNWTLRTNEIIWTFSTTVELCTVCQNKVIFLIWTFDLVFIYPGCPEEATKATNYKPKVKSEDEQKRVPNEFLPELQNFVIRHRSWSLRKGCMMMIWYHRLASMLISCRVFTMLENYTKSLISSRTELPNLNHKPEEVLKYVQINAEVQFW